MRRLAFMFVFCAAPVLADGGGTRGMMPPPDYAKPVFTDARGCSYVRAEVGDWVLWVQAEDDAGKPQCGGRHEQGLLAGLKI